MTTVLIDNSDAGEIDKTILWQYEHAHNVVGVIEFFARFFKASTTDFFDALMSRYDLSRPIAGDATSGESGGSGSEEVGLAAFGLAVWGRILAQPRPYLGGSVGAMMSDDLYRRLLLGKLRLLYKRATLGDFQEYADLVFGEGKVGVLNNLDMSIEYVLNSGAEVGEQEACVLDSQEDLLVHPAGVLTSLHSASPMFGLDGQQPQEASDPEVGGLDDSGFCWRYTPKGNWCWRCPPPDDGSGAEEGQ